MSNKLRQTECDVVVADPSALVREFVSAVGDWRTKCTYDNRLEDFYPGKGRGEPRSRETGVVTKMLEKQETMSVPAPVLTGS